MIVDAAKLAIDISYPRLLAVSAGDRSPYTLISRRATEVESVLLGSAFVLWLMSSPRVINCPICTRTPLRRVLRWGPCSFLSSFLTHLLWSLCAPGEDKWAFVSTG